MFDSFYRFGGIYLDTDVLSLQDLFHPETYQGTGVIHPQQSFSTGTNCDLFSAVWKCHIKWICCEDFLRCPIQSRGQWCNHWRVERGSISQDSPSRDGTNSDHVWNKQTLIKIRSSIQDINFNGNAWANQVPKRITETLLKIYSHLSESLKCENLNFALFN